QGNGLLGDAVDFHDPVVVDVEFAGELVQGRFSAELLVQAAAGAGQPVDALHHVHGDPDGAGLVRDGAGDRLPDPPGGVGGELVSAGVVELLHRADEPQVALLDQVEQGQTAAQVALGDRHHQAQVRFDQ